MRVKWMCLDHTICAVLQLSVRGQSSQRQINMQRRFIEAMYFDNFIDIYPSPVCVASHSLYPIPPATSPINATLAYKAITILLVSN